MSAKHTPGPWSVYPNGSQPGIDGEDGCFTVIVYGDEDEPDIGIQGRTSEERQANARLIAAAPDQHAEMLRYLPVLERAYADGELWDRLTEGLGIATLNGYRAAIAKATGEQA